MKSQHVRPPAVAGTFYPAGEQRARAALEAAFADARGERIGPPPKAIVAPHAGWAYSGAIAASAYRTVDPRHVSRVVLLGPSHFVPFRGMAIASVDAFETPLGIVPVDPAWASQLSQIPHAVVDDLPHTMEHSLEVQVPFLQTILGAFDLLPVAVGVTTADEVSSFVDAAWGGEETLIVVSSDLSHYLDYEGARATDSLTAEAIEGLRWADLGDRDACGVFPLRGTLLAASRRGLGGQMLDLRNSGDTSGEKDRVVGYGAFAIG
jgi:AmmeMemoRadiSam system protein B